MRLARRVTGAVALLCMLTGCGSASERKATPVQQFESGPTSVVKLVRQGDLWSLELGVVPFDSFLGGRAALKPGVIYALLQPSGSITTAAISKVIGKPPVGDSIKLDAGQFLLISPQNVVGYVCAVADGPNQQLQRWLLLDAYQNASTMPTILKPAISMDPVPPGGPQLPPDVGEFIKRARKLFEAAKSGAADPCAEHTRYVKARAKLVRVTGEPSPIQPYFPKSSDLPPYLDPPEPAPVACASSGTPGGQLDPGTIGLRLQSGPLVGVVQETVTGDTGGAKWFLSPSYVDPADTGATEYIVIGSLSGVTNTELESLSTSAGGNLRTWNVILETCRYHRKTFPASPND